ncbi:histone-lysine N-methyltransferase 2A isoform X1 [Coregonus clupeaformis]|uniref:histone-lysine N-methyltransferase 2A isoform X1 n=1 Tax=Coregonus clupeaformis TaxID=59861 RepID=UPI001BDFEE92|nr:histone-lysine N-methyltransferase 2A isoform X1 [Coregonus clupeaformis]
MAAAGGGLSSPANVAGSSTPSVARARFPGRPWTSRSRLRSEKRPQRGRLGFEGGEVVTGGPRPINIGLTLSEDPSLLRLLGIADKHRRQRDAGFYSSGSGEDEDFTGFGTEYRPTLSAHNISESRPLQLSLLKPEKPPPAPELTAKLEKSGGKCSDEDPEVGEGQEEENAVKPKIIAELAAQKKSPSSGVKSTGKQATGTKASKGKGSAKSNGSNRKRGSKVVESSSTARKGNRQGQTTKVGRGGSGSSTARPQTSRDKQGKLVWTLTVVKGKGKASKSKESDEVTADKTETDQAEPQRSGKRRRGSQQDQTGQTGADPDSGQGQRQAQSRTGRKTTDLHTASQGVALSPRPVNKQQQRRSVSKGTGESLEAGAEMEQEPAMSQERKKPAPYKRKSIFGLRRKPGNVHRLSPLESVEKRFRRKFVFYTYVPEYLPATVKQEGKEQQPSPEEIGQGASSNLSSPVVSARSSRVIKAPKRFLNDEIISWPRGSLKKKSQDKVKEDAMSLSFYDSDNDDVEHVSRTPGQNEFKPKVAGSTGKKTLQTSLSSTLSVKDSTLSPGSSHLEVYERLKKLTLSLAQKKKKGLSATEDEMAEEEEAQEDLSLTSPVRKRGRSKLKMEDLNSPGVVRKLAVLVSNAAAASQAASSETLEEAANDTDHFQGAEAAAEGVYEGESRDDGVVVEQGGTSHRINLTGTNKRMFHLLKRAKVQLIKIDQLKRAKLQLVKIDQQRQMKSSQLLSGSVKLGPRDLRIGGGRRIGGSVQDQLLGGPRIKHVCRAAAVALGQPRAMVPDNIPRLSALPLHEREGITTSPAVEDIADDPSDQEIESTQEHKTTRQKHKYSKQRKFKRNSNEVGPGGRATRCGSCQGCLHEGDCGTCFNCLDKPKFGGPNTRRQCCVLKRCVRIEARKVKRGIKPFTVLSRRRRRSSANGLKSKDDEGSESWEEGEAQEGLAPATPGDCLSPSTRKQPRRNVTHRSYSSLLKSDSDEDTDGEAAVKKSPVKNPVTPSSQVSEEGPVPSEVVRHRRPGPPKGLLGRRRDIKGSDSEEHRPGLLVTEGHITRSPSEPCPPRIPPLRLRRQLLVQLQRLPPCVVQSVMLEEEEEPEEEESSQEEEETIVKEAVLQHNPRIDPHYVLRSQNAAEHTPTNILATLTNGHPQKSHLKTGTHRIRVDFKEDCAVQNVWLMGGLSILTSVPVTPQPVCLLCASKGHHEMIYCQVCCEPFHSFCLWPEERPQEENKENWCCRRCKFCHVCGRKSKNNKPVLQCRRCQNCYHPSCLGPTYPKPINCNMPWVCMTCIRCKSCGVTPGKTWDMAWNHEQDLCPDCNTLHSKGNFCTICSKCYEENNHNSQMMECSKCSHWVHSKCEGLSDDLYEIMSSLSESIVYSCTPCSQSQPGSWKEELKDRLRAGLEKVLANLLSDSSAQHLITCRECEESTEPDAFRDQQQPICDLHAVGQKFEGRQYTSLKSFHEDVVVVMRRWLKEEESLPEDLRPTCLARSHYLKLLGETFSWFHSQDQKMWDPLSKDFPSGMLPEAVLPPSKEHSYAQWLERTYQVTSGAGCFQQGNCIPPPSSVTTHQPWALEGLPLKSQGTNGAVTGALEFDRTKDERQCALCQQCGDATPNDAGRLLYLGQNEWAHVNCCLWSAEVYEDNGALLQVHSAVSRGRYMRCERCGQAGATVGCCLSSCQSNYHFMCARARNCVFQEDRKVFCSRHRDLVSEKMVSGNGFDVLRRVYVDFEGISLRRKFLTGLEPESINMTIGSLQINRLGVLTELSANGARLCPVGYQCSRLYWSTVDPRRRCKYTCKVTEVCSPLPEKPGEPLWWDQEENQTIAHSPSYYKEMEITEAVMSPPPIDVSPSTTSSPLKQEPGAKTPGYSQTRRPAGGTSRPLPSPGSAMSKSHHILTLRDLDDTRRPRRLSLSCHSGDSSSPTDSLAGPMMLRSGGTLHPRSLPFSSPPRTSENLLSSHRRVRPCAGSSSWGSPPLSLSSLTSPLSLRPGAAGSPPSNLPLAFRHSSRIRQPFKIRTPVSAEVPQYFLASSEPEKAVEAPSNGITLTANNMEEDTDVSPLMSDQDLPFTTFDVADADVAVASVLNAKLEFDEALLNENVALHCGGSQTGGGDMEEEALEEETQSQTQGRDNMDANNKAPVLTKAMASKDDLENGSSDEDMDHYLKFSRTVVVCEASKDSGQAGLPLPPPPPTSQSIAQLDGADNGSESDSSEATGDQEETHEEGKSGEAQGADSQQVFETFDPNNDMSIEEEVLMDSDQTESQNEVLLDPSSGHFVSADDGTRVYLANNKKAALDDSDSDSSGSSTDSLVGVDDEMGDPDFEPEPKPNQKSPPVKTIKVMQRPSPVSMKTIQPKPTPTQKKVIRVTLPSGPALPLNVASSSPPIAVRTVPRTVPSTTFPTQFVINGMNSIPLQTGATRGRAIAIRLATPRQEAQQQLTATILSGASNSAPSPQVLLVNRQGQILMKDPNTNTFQTVSTSSPSYSRISQIAKMIHSSGALPRAVPQVVVVPSTSTPSPRTAVFHSSHLITSNRNNTTTPTTISNRNNTTPASNTNLLIRAPQSLHDGRVLVQAMPVTSEPVRVKCVSVPGNQAQAILDRAMATHREPTRIRPNILRVSPSHLSPSQFQVQPFFNKLQSPVAISAAPGQMLRHEPATVPESHSQSQVRVKRVSSVAERPGKKKCKTDFLPQSPSCDLDDLDGSRNSGVRIKAPTMKDVLDLDQEKVELKVISPPEPEKIRPPPIPQMERPPSSSTTQSSSNIHGKTHVWVSARHGDLSDWGPYSGFSSDDDMSPPKQDKTRFANRNQPHLRFEITSDDGFHVQADSIEVAWRAVTDGVLEARAGFHLKALPLGGVSGARVLGLLHDAVIFLLEQLQGAAGCKQHRFRFHRYDTPDDELPINPSGCARAEVYSRKSTFDMFNFLASQHRQLPDIMSTPCDEEDDDVPLKSTRRATSTELPMAMRFRHLEKTSKEAVGVYRSEIHGRGLFCKRNIEAGEMVIEYAGNVIRAVLTDKKEKYYDSKGIGCYMFRIDDFDVVDATMHGNAARFINHSCEPNCYSRVILVDSHKHIVIFALRKIYRGEELTYDYKFPIEDDGSKLHCNCAARRCRRFLN